MSTFEADNTKKKDQRKIMTDNRPLNTMVANKMDHSALLATIERQRNLILTLQNQIEPFKDAAHEAQKKLRAALEENKRLFKLYNDMRIERDTYGNANKLLQERQRVFSATTACHGVETTGTMVTADVYTGVLQPEPSINLTKE